MEVIRIKKILAQNWPIGICLHCVRKIVVNRSDHVHPNLHHIMPPYTRQVKGAKYSVSDFEAEHFWQWTDFQSFIECTVCFVAVGSFVMYLLLKYDPFVETVGFLAVFTEAMLGTPQFYRNFTNKSTYGMRFAIWLITVHSTVFIEKKEICYQITKSKQLISESLATFCAFISHQISTQK